MRPEQQLDFEILAKTVAAAIFIVQDDMFRYVNDAGEAAMSGYSRDELSRCASGISFIRIIAKW